MPWIESVRLPFDMQVGVLRFPQESTYRRGAGVCLHNIFAAFYDGREKIKERKKTLEKHLLFLRNFILRVYSKLKVGPRAQKQAHRYGEMIADDGMREIYVSASSL